MMNSSVEKNYKISIVMGSQSDWPCLKKASIILDELKVPHEVKIISAHRTPDRLYKYSEVLILLDHPLYLSRKLIICITYYFRILIVSIL